MAETNDCVFAVNDLFILANDRNYIDDGLADDDSWVENISQDEDDVNEIHPFSEPNLQTDIEEGLQGYDHCNAIDFTLHTIAEESCEDSELEHNDDGMIEDTKSCSESALISQSELERYFFFGLGDGKKCADQEDSSSEVFSESSDNLDSSKNDVSLRDSKHGLDLSTSRLERYFLSGFMGFNTENKSDGSVGSDSEGQASPSHRKKKFVRARGTPRSINTSLDNLLLDTTDCLADTPEILNSSESETESLPSVKIISDKPDNVDSAKRKKNYRKRELSEFGKKTVESIVHVKNQSNAGACQKPNIKINVLTTIPALPAKSSIDRKDSFHYSSDEETNLMMSKMRQFFKTLIAVTAQSYSQSNNFGPYPEHFFQKRRINNQKVREIVEYFSSEENWSDSNDSSDCNGSNHRNSPDKFNNEERLAEYNKNSETDTRKKSNASISETLNTSSVMAYANLIESIISNNSKINPEVLGVDNMCNNYNEKCPEVAVNVMQHIGSKLVALMHDVSIGTDSIVTPNTENDFWKSEENTSNIGLDHPDYSSHLWGNLPRSKSHDILLGSTSRSWHFNSSSTVSDNQGEVSDCDRFSWRGSFESALLAPGDSTSKLLFAERDNCSISSEVSMSKRGSAGNLHYAIIQSREQLDRVQSCGSIGISDMRTRSGIQKTWLSSLADMKCETNLELSSRINVKNLIYTNSLPRLQSLEFPVISDKSQSDSNVIRFSAKSARYRPPSCIQTNIFSSLSTKKNLKAPGLYPLNNFKCDMVSSTSLDSNINKTPGLQKNVRKSIHSDSLLSLYSEAFDSRYDNIQIKGQIEFSMLYNYKISAFEIHIRKCKDLAAADTKRLKSDPYVKIYLLPDKSKNGKRKTKVKKNTLNPLFDEIVRFNVSIANLETRSIWITVWHSDIFGRNIFLGEVAINLKGKVFDNPQPQWYLLQEKDGQIDKNLMDRGDLVVALKFIVLDSHITTSDCSFNSKGQLHVLIKEAKNLQSSKPSGTCDTFCKSYLLPNRARTSKQKTHIFKKSLNPIWNFTFIYDNLTLQELSERALELTVWDRDRLLSNQFLGGARFSLGTGERYGIKVSWMDSTGKELFLWREMMNRPNFWVEGCISLRSVLDTKKEEYGI